MSERSMKTAISLMLTLLFAVMPAAGEHIVPPGELLEHTRAAGEKRNADLAKVRGFFSSETAKEALRTAGIDSQKVLQVAATLSDDELSRLASQVQAAQKDFAAGALTNQQLTYIVIALGTAVLVLLIVAA